MPVMLRLVTWQGVDEWRAEAARIGLHPDGVEASGTQIGAGYRIDYELRARDGWRTQALTVTATTADGGRALRLARADAGWTRDGEPVPGLEGARDCDLGLSPLTNLMPVRRHSLHEREGAAEIVAAWVSVPDLEVHASPQRYEHVRPGVVRYVDLGTHAGFTAELELDADGLVLHYPGLARAVTPGPSSGPRSPS
jgi:uncharacterized protein